MKKIYALVALAFATTAFGQTRANLNVSLTLTTPVDGSVVPQDAAQSIVFTVKSTGDALIDGDTLALYYFNKTTSKTYSMIGQTEGQLNILPLTGQMAAALPLLNGGTGITSDQLQQGGLKLNTTATGFNVGDTIMVVVEVWGKNGEVEPDANFTNNFGSFKLKAASVSVNELSKVEMVAFPNPATTVLNVTTSEDVKSLSVLSLDGKVVATSNTNSVNVAGLSAGAYLYQVTTVNGNVSTSRFIKE